MAVGELNNNVLTVTLVGGGALLLIIYLVTRKRSAADLPPGPPGIPLYGNSLDIAKSVKHGPGIFDRWAQQYGDLYHIHLGSYPTIVLNSLETMKEALVKNSDKTSGRPTNVLFYKLFASVNQGIVFNDGPLWKRLRRTTLHSLKDFGMGKKSLEQRIQGEARALVQYLDNLEREAFDPRIPLHNAFTNVIASIVFGERYEYDDPEFTHLSDLLNVLFASGGLSNPERFIPLMTPVIPLINPVIFRGWKVIKELERFVKKTIKNHIDQFDPEVTDSFIDIYLKEKFDGKFQDTDNEKQLFMSIFDLFTAGSDTSATTTRWALLYLIHYPDVQAKCQQIIKEAIGPEKIPDSTDRNKLVYVEATLCEIQRLATIAPNAVLHRVTETFQLCGYTIPKDTLIVPNLHRVHRDPRYWTNPDCFNPNRWIDSQGSLIRHEHFVPFSVGPRECIGKMLATQEMFIFFVSLLQRFTVTAKDPENLPKLSGSVGVVYHPDDFEIILHRL